MIKMFLFEYKNFYFKNCFLKYNVYLKYSLFFLLWNSILFLVYDIKIDLIWVFFVSFCFFKFLFKWIYCRIYWVEFVKYELVKYFWDKKVNFLLIIFDFFLVEYLE